MDKKINLGPIEKVPLGQGFCFIVNEEEIAVFRPRSGGIYATHNRCPHRKAPLCEGLVGERQVVCPYHGHKFDSQTGAGSENGETVAVYEVEEKDGEIFLKI